MAKKKTTLETKIEGIQSEVKTYGDWLATKDQQSRSKLYDLLQNAYGVVCELADDKNEPLLETLMGERDLSYKDDTNPLTPLVQLLWGKWGTNTKGAKVWKSNTSASKYANVFRYLMAQGVPAATVAKHTANYKHKTHGNRMEGIINADRAANPNKKGIAKRKKKLDHIETKTSGVEFTMPPGAAAKAQDGWIVMFGRVDGSKMKVIRAAEFKDKKAMENFVVAQVDDDEIKKAKTSAGSIQKQLAKLQAAS